MLKNVLSIVIAMFMMAGATVAVAQVASAEKPAVSCQKAGMNTLKDLGAFQAAAKGEVDYSAFADAENGPIFADLPEGSFLPLKDVLALHRSNPELFAWCS